MTARYAETTKVSSEASRAEIERILTRYGASSFMYAWENGRAAIAFVKEGRPVRFELPLPDPDDRRFTRSPTGRTRTRESARTEWERGVRQSWRALALVIKAKLEAIEAGIVSFETEFLPHFVTADGSTIAQRVVPGLDAVLADGQLALTGARDV